jgi:hypothetical protein
MPEPQRQHSQLAEQNVGSGALLGETVAYTILSVAVAALAVTTPAAGTGEQMVETTTIFASTGITQPGGAMNWQLGGILTWGWFPAFAFRGGLRERQYNLAA